MPTLKHGDTVVHDNLQAHKVSGIRERIDAAGACPPNRPTFISIELAFAKLKAGLRAEAARTVADLCDTLK